MTAGMTAISLLDALWRSGALRTIDHALAQSLRRLDPATPDTVLAAAALASLAVAHGHAGFDLSSPRTLIDNSDIPWPDADAWRRELAASRWITTPAAGGEVADPSRPLVLEGAPGAPGAPPGSGLADEGNATVAVTVASGVDQDAEGVTLEVEGMTCASCVNRIERFLTALAELL